MKSTNKINIKGTTSKASLNNKNEEIKIIEHLNMSEYTHYLNTNVNIDIPLFNILPKKIIYNEYVPFGVYETTITLQNQDYVPRRVKIIPPDSNYFFLSAPKIDGRNILTSSNDKIAPGAYVTYILTFKPHEKVDISLDLIVCTEREKFILPVKAIGLRSILNFPGEIIFPKNPVKFNSTRPVFLRNVGSKSTRFRIHTIEPFLVEPSDGFLNIDEHTQIIVSFCPNMEGNFEGDLIIEDEDEQKFLCRLFGSSECVDVHLEAQDLNMAPTYIGLTSQHTFRLMNNSQVPVKYEWNQFATSILDENYVNNVLIELNKQEQEELNSIDDVPCVELDPEELSDDDEELIHSKRVQVISRKYKNLREQCKETKIPYNNSNFEFDPPSGEIWPSGFVDFVAYFKPQDAMAYSTTAYLEVVGRSSRLPIFIRGQGIGPKAAFTYDSLDIGEVYVNALYKYSVTLQNIGEIDAVYELLENGDGNEEISKFKSRFEFTPTSGRLAPNLNQDFDIGFNCKVLGPFSEIVEWKIFGRLEPLTLTFKGNVIGPKYSFDCRDLDFGLVSYGFVQAKTIKLRNDSDIPLKFQLSVPEDGKYYQKEFGIMPSSGNLMPHESINVNVEFLPTAIKKYLCNLIVDIDGIGTQATKLQIKAESTVPVLTLPSATIDFYECYINYPYVQRFEIFNSSNLPGKYEVIVSEEICQHFGVSFDIDFPQGSIPSKTSNFITITSRYQRVGPISLKIHVRTGGADATPLAVQINALAIGPTLEVSPNTLDFNTEVLKLVSQPLKLFNNSPIPASIKSFSSKKGSSFYVEPCEFDMEPYQSIEINAFVFMDDTIKQNDSIYVMVEDGSNIIIPCEAKALGTTIFSEKTLDIIDLGAVFSSSGTSKQIKLENRGRRAQQISWEFSKRLGEVSGELSKVSSYRVVPDKMLMPPLTAMVYTIEGYSTESGVLSELWNCNSLVTGNKSSTTIFSSEFKCDFVLPLLSFNPPINDGVSFEYIFKAGKPIMPQYRTIKMKNTSALRLIFFIRCSPPFSVDSLEYELNPGEETDLIIQFEPGMKTDRISAIINQNLTISYRDHSQKDKINLIGNICFPNLEFEKQVVDFECVQNETSHRMTVKVTNPSQLVPSKYSWSFIDEVSSLQAPDNNKFSLNEIFDISPIRGNLEPGESEIVTFIFNGHTDCKLSTIAVCEVTGGPSYEIILNGESSSVNYSLSCTTLAFPDLPFSLSSTLEMFITNTSRVSFDYNLNLQELTVFNVTPSSGRLKANEKQKITVVFTPGIPRSFSEQFQLRASYFDPVSIKLDGRGCYPQIHVTLPREESFAFSSCLNTTKSLDLSQTPFYSVLPASSWNELEAERLIFIENISKLSNSACSVDIPSLVISEFVCNLGYIIRGMSKNKRFKVTNVHQTPISMEFNTKVLAKCSSFSIEPMKVQKLPPGESVEFNINFVANKSQELKINELDLPLEIKEGPGYLLKLRASVTIPAMEISRLNVDFGTVQTGYSRTCTLIFKNKEQVPCEWVVNKMVGNRTGEDVVHFSCNPEQGVLLPGESSKVKVSYRPYSVHDDVGCKLPIRVTSNPRAMNITLKGSSMEQSCKFEPQILNMAPIIPGSDTFGSISLINDSDADLDLYSVDYDESFAIEENILRAANWDSSGELLVAPRKPGQPLPFSIISAYQRLLDDAECNELRTLLPDDSIELPPSRRNVLIIGKHVDDVSTISAAIHNQENKRLISWNSMFAAVSEDPDNINTLSDLAPLKTGTNDVQILTTLLAKLAKQFFLGPVNRLAALKGFVFEFLPFFSISPTILLNEFFNAMKVHDCHATWHIVQLDRSTEDLNNQNDDQIIDFYNSMDLVIASLSNALFGEYSVVNFDDFEIADKSKNEFKVDLKDSEKLESFDTPLVHCRSILSVNNSSNLTLLALNALSQADIARTRELETFQILHKPIARTKKSLEKSFSIVAAGKKGDESSTNSFRWVIPARSTLSLKLKYFSDVVGKHETTLSFEVFGRWSGSKPQIYSFSVNGKCAYPEITNDPRTVFMRRVKNKKPNTIVKKTFITDSNLFEFGPLLIGKNQVTKKDKATVKTYAEPFRIANIGLFPCRVEFSLASKDMKKDIETFLFEPEFMDLQPEEVKELTVWAMPSSVGTFEDSIICNVAQNPTSISFPLRCEGSKPNIEVVGGKIEFERLLSGQSEKKVFTLTNKSSVPAQWNLYEDNVVSSTVLSLVLEEIKIEPASGILKPNSSQEVIVQFHAAKQREILNKLKLDVTDVEGVLGLVESFPVTIKAEAFDVDYKVDIPANGIEFGTLMVGDEKRVEFNFKNSGKYEIKYNVNSSKRREITDYFSIIPGEGQLKSNETVKFTAVFKSNKEVSFKGINDFKIQIFDLGTNISIVSIPVRLSATSVYSKFRILPNQGINFGPLELDSSRSKKFEIMNDGEFEFDLKCFQSLDEEKKNKDVKDKGKLPSNLSIGSFTITPSFATIPPRGKLTVDVVLTAKTSGIFSEQFFIQVSNADPKDSTIKYELNGEGCSPGIETGDFESIFEEQMTALHAADVKESKKNMFFLEEKMFQFGPSISGDSAAPTIERFKIINPFKVPCNVKFESKPRANDAKSIEDAQSFTIEPSNLHIPSHEYRFVSVIFKPREMKQINAIFSATVDKGTDVKTKSLSFELRGEGTLPHVSITKPNLRDEVGNYLMAFPRTFLGKSVSLPISIRNDGKLATNIRLDLISDHFKFGKSTIMLEPGQSSIIDITFSSAVVGSHSTDLLFRVAQNPFEDRVFKLTGETYQEDVTLDIEDNELNFGDVALDEISTRSFHIVNHSNYTYRFYNDGLAGISFSPSIGHLAPHSFRFITATVHSSAPLNLKKENVLTSLSKIELSSSVSEYWDNSKKEVMFMTDKQFELWKQHQFNLLEHSKRKAIAQADAIKSKKPFKEEDLPVYSMLEDLEDAPQQRQISTQEPSFNILENNNIALKVSAIVDCPKYSCNLVNPILFHPTLMFQSRSFKFPIKNTGTTSLHFSWKSTIIQPQEFIPSLLPITDLNPFLIIPSTGIIAPNQEEEFSIKFSPWDAIDFHTSIEAEILNDKSGKELRFDLKGAGLRPKAHIELPPCDYLSVGRRPADMRNPDGTLGALDANVYRVIEMESLGTKVRNTKRFYILNPTNMSYTFEWTCQDVVSTPFRCNTIKGTVLAGKKSEMVFEYLPEDIGHFESFWKLTIPENEINVPFIFVGKVAEPDIFLEKPHINFNALLIGSKLRETVCLVNHEHLPFSFTIDGNSYQSDQSFEIEPKSGVIPGNSSFPLQITFCPTEEKNYNSNLQFKIKNKSGKVMLNVKGEGYSIRDLVQVEESSGLNATINTAKPYQLDFGVVQLHDRQVKQITLFNNGKYNFDFAWNFPKTQKIIEISPESGSVKKGSQLQCSVSFFTNKEVSVDNLKANLTIGGGSRQYVFSVSGSGHRPKLEFSSNNIDFGPQFVGAKASSSVITIINREKIKNVTVDALFDNKAFLEVRGSASVLAPGESADYNVVFIPKDFILIEETILFEVNGVLTIPVKVTGEGVPLRLEFASPAQQNVNFGNLRIGTNLVKTIRLTNQSKKAVEFSLIENSRLVSNYITFAPDVTKPKSNVIRPRQSLDLSIRFSPNDRLPLFNEDVQIEVEELVRPLLRISGACHGVGLILDTDNIPFGPVILNSQLSKRLMLENIGDVACKYRFDASKFLPDFSINPVEGICSQRDSIAIDVIFHPTALNGDIRYSKLPCFVEGADTLFLTLTGSCIPTADEDAKELKFECKVRKSISRSITVENITSARWNLTPSISNDAWTCPKVLDIPSNGKADYEITYHPSKMTGDNADKGELFFALPTGAAIVYKLSGISSAPDAEDKIEVEAPCKKLVTKSLNIKNWLPTSQRFKVIVDSEENDPSVSIKCAASVEVPGILERDFKLSFYAYKEGITHSTVKFLNEVTGEYSFYKLSWKATKAGILSNILLETSMRQKVTSILSIRNPLDSSIEISRFESDNSDIFVVLPIVINPDSDGNVEVCFRPLTKYNNNIASLTLFSPQLGEFRYTFDLSCNSVTNERTLRFDSNLGSDVVQKFRFTSYELTGGDYECKVTGQEFTVDPKIKSIGCSKGSEGEELTVDIKYEPTTLGDVRDTLTIKKGNAEYKVPLQGHSQPPRPQGPISIKSGGSINIPFKNVFCQTEEFSYSVDNPLFILAKKVEKIEGKKTVQISLSCKKDDKSKNALGKLYVACPNLPPFIYYLKGDI